MSNNKHWLLKEAITPTTLERELGKYKALAKGAISGKAEDYVDVLEFTAQFLAGHTSVDDKELKKFLAFVDKLVTKGSSTSNLKAKEKKVNDIESAIEKGEEPEEIELDAGDVQGIPATKSAPGKAKPPPPPKDATEPEKKPAFGKAPAAPSLASLAGKDDDQGDYWDKVTKQATNLHNKMPKDEPVAANAASSDIKKGPSDDTDPNAGKAYKPKGSNLPVATRQNWAVGQKVNVGFVKDLTVKRKIGNSTYVLEKDGKQYLFEPWGGGLKPIRK